MGILRRVPHLFGCVGHRDDGYISSRFALRRELHPAIGEGEERVVLATADIGAGMPFGPTLPHNNVDYKHGFAE